MRKKKVKENPLADVSTRQKGKVNDRRIPFQDSKAQANLETLRTDRFKQASSYMAASSSEQAV